MSIKKKTKETEGSNIFDMNSKSEWARNGGEEI